MLNIYALPLERLIIIHKNFYAGFRVLFPKGDYKILDKLEYEYHKNKMQYSKELELILVKPPPPKSMSQVYQ